MYICNLQAYMGVNSFIAYQGNPFAGGDLDFDIKKPVTGNLPLLFFLFPEPLTVSVLYSLNTR